MGYHTAVFALLALLPGVAMGAGEVPAETRRVLDPFTGVWRGTFKVHSQSGELVTRLEVEQRYWWDGNVQRGRFIETDQDGNTVTAEARNFVGDNGKLLCVVEKSNGEGSRHRGSVHDGHLFWHSRQPGRVETFREAVHADEEGTFYRIHGFGVYGQGDDAAHFLFVGEYRRVAEQAEAASTE